MTEVSARTVSRVPSGPPRPLSSFVGRRPEIQELEPLLAATRLLTLTGVAGSGKTRLAIELAGRVRQRFEDGVAYADLTPLRDPDPVRGLLALAVGLDERAAGGVIELIGDARLLIVVDNAEHLLEPVSSLLTEILTKCPNVQVLVTSRELLNLDGEVSWRVPPLALPPQPSLGIPLDLGELAASDAIQLFLSRAAEHQAVLELTRENAACIEAICRRLDGIPLALELAAVRVRSMGLTELAARLDDSFRLLTLGTRTAIARHKTLRTAIEWSEQLLDPQERLLLLRLAVFIGTFDLAAIEAVCSGPELPREEVGTVLHRLVDKSLVVPRTGTDGSVRYALLEIIRQYAHERLLADGEESVLRIRHAEHYANLLQRLETDEVLAKARLQRTRSEYDNVQLALDWASNGDGALEARMVESLRWFWRVRGGSFLEPRQRVLSALAKQPADLKTRARFHIYVAGYSGHLRDFQTARVHMDRAAPLIELLGDPGLTRLFLRRRAALAIESGDLATAERDLSAALDGLDELPACAERGEMLNGRAVVRLPGDHVADAIELAQRSIAELEVLPDQGFLLSTAIHTLGAALLNDQRITAARDCFLDGLRLMVDEGHDFSAVANLYGLACTTAREGRPALCVELLGAAHACMLVTGMHTPADFTVMPYEDAERASRAALGDAAADEAWNRGLRLDLRAALRRAEDAGPTEPEQPLTPRKTEIVRLVAAGLSNRDIAKRLSIGERTVEAHLDQIRNQLGLRNRAQVATWATARGLVAGL